MVTNRDTDQQRLAGPYRRSDKRMSLQKLIRLEMQNRYSFVRLWIAFLVAPVVPALLWYLLNLTAPRGESILLIFILVPFAYLATIVLGVPAYLVLQRRNVQSWWAYVVLGAIIGGLFAWIVQGIDIISHLSSSKEHAMALLNKSMKITPVAVIYGGTSSVVFWMIAIWRR